MSDEIEFLGGKVKGNKEGYRASVKVYRDFMEEQGIPGDTVTQVNTAHEKLHGHMLDFAAERVVTDDKPKVKIVVPVSDAITMDATVHRKYERPGSKFPERNEDGSVKTDPDSGETVYRVTDPVVQYGRCEVGMTIKLSDDLKGKRDSISKRIEDACKD